MVSTQDLSFGSMWTRLVGERARWDAGDVEAPGRPPGPRADDLPPLGPGLVAVWVRGEGPVLVCDPQKGLRALKVLRTGTPVEALRTALREAGAVKREETAPRSEE